MFVICMGDEFDMYLFVFKCPCCYSRGNGLHALCFAHPFTKKSNIRQAKNAAKALYIEKLLISVQCSVDT